MTQSRATARKLALVAATALFCAWGCELEPEAEPQCVGTIESRPVPNQTDSTFPIGPALVFVNETSATIMWETEGDDDNVESQNGGNPDNGECDGLLEYGESGQALSTRVTTDRQDRVHKARLTGLEAGVRYDYRASACGKETGTLSFHAAPSPTTPVRFAIWGDSQGHPERAAPIVEAMSEFGAHFTVHNGDTVLDGNVKPQWKDEFFEPARSMAHHIPTFVTMGNHEKNARYYYDYTDYPYPEELANHEVFGSNYSFSYGNTFFLMIDTQQWQLYALAFEEMELASWIRTEMASERAQAATWRIAVAHQPGFTESWTPNECGDFEGLGPIATWLFPRLEENGFHLFSSGHTHAYERGSSHGVTHLISGGGGGGLDEWCTDLPETEVANSVHHYVQVEAGCDTLRLRAIEIPGDGGFFDEVVISRGD
jgi:hypothetical protein